MWIRGFLAFLLSCCLLALPSLSWADESGDTYDDVGKITLPAAPDRVPGEPDIGPAISPMKWGQKAPFTGVLLSPIAIATIIAELNAVDKLVAIELERERRTQEAETEFRVEQVRIVLEADKKILLARAEAREEETKLLNERLKKAEDNTTNTALWLGGGFVSGVLVTVLTTFAVSYATGSR